MRQRDIIYLKENEFCITGTDIWMSEWELAELFYATQGEIRAHQSHAERWCDTGLPQHEIYAS